MNSLELFYKTQTKNSMTAIGRNTLFAKLHERGILLNKNEPLREYVERGYFDLMEKLIKRGNLSFAVIKPLTRRRTKVPGRTVKGNSDERKLALIE